jgi:steroid delta-isomerase-like uncharacterized protein
MTPEQLVRRRVDIINSGDHGALGEVLAADVITHYGSGEAVHGLEPLAGLLASFEAFDDLHVTIEDLAVDGDRVGARYTSRARQRAAFAGIPNTGASVEFIGAGIHRIQDGRIAEVWTVDDWVAMTRQLRSPRSASSPRTPRHGTRNASPETVAANKRTAAHWIDLTNARTFDRLSEDWAQDAAVHQSRDVDDVVGLEAFVALLESFYAGMPDLNIQVEDVVGEGNVVFLRTSSRGSHTGELFGIHGSGRTVSYEGITTYHLADGKITHEWFNDDMFALIQTIRDPTGAAAPRAGA